MKLNFTDLKTDCQYLLPKQLLTILAGWFASAKLGSFTTFMIKKFAEFYHINAEEAEKDFADYQTFNEFFSRALKDGSRPVAAEKNAVVFPVDGTISQFGELKDNLLLQAKNHYYTAEALLGGEDAETFKDGNFITIYLSPSDYHRVHIPYGGKLQKMVYIPGKLFSVNPFNAEHIPELFSRNERVVCLFDTDMGKMAVVFVGATIVRSIVTDWAGTVAPNKAGEVKVYTYENEKIAYAKGAEIGKFMMGSTVICLFEKNKTEFVKTLQAGQKTKTGEKMAVRKK